MKKKGSVPFGVIITIILVIVVLGIGLNILGLINFPGKIDQAVADAEKLAASYEVAESMCPGEGRLSDPIKAQIAQDLTANAGPYWNRILSNSWMVYIDGVEENEGEWIVHSLYRTDRTADYTDLWSCPCLSGIEDKVAAFEFVINDTSTADAEFSFKPDCSRDTSVSGCCVHGTETDDKPGWSCCYYSKYEWTYWGQDGNGINVLLPNDHIIEFWSNYRTKYEGSGNGDYHNCVYDGNDEKFGKEKYHYYYAKFNMTYSVCCPEGYEYNETHSACCSDHKCGNIICKNAGGTWMYNGCWFTTTGSCTDVCTSKGMACDLGLAGNVERNCLLHEKIFGVGPPCAESSPSKNNLAPYKEGANYYYYNISETTNYFDCDAADGSVQRICPCS